MYLSILRQKKKNKKIYGIISKDAGKFDIHPCKHSQQTEGSILNLMTSSKHLSTNII